MKKTIYLNLVCMLAAGAAQGALIAAGAGWDADDLGASPETNQFTVTVAADGNDWLYTWTKTGDLDGLGTTDDTLSFQLRSSAYTGSSFASGNVTLGTAHDYSVGGTVTAPSTHPGPGGDIDNNESFQLSVENIVFTQGEALGWVATFNGFSNTNRFGGSASADYYFGVTGAETVVGGNGFTGPVQVLTVTSTVGGSRFRDFDFAFTTQIPEPSSFALVGMGVSGLLIRRRRG